MALSSGRRSFVGQLKDALFAGNPMQIGHNFIRREMSGLRIILVIIP
jgi:hypothetical protein